MPTGFLGTRCKGVIGLKILHISDIHLKEDAPERLEAFQRILSVANEEHVDLLIIAGDMFDEEEADRGQASLLPFSY